MGLVNAANKAVPEPLRSNLPDKAVDDLVSAGRCLAFGLFTAAGFHTCRVVEAVLEMYYQRFCMKSGTLRSWNDYINELEPKVASAAPQGRPRQRWSTSSR